MRTVLQKVGKIHQPESLLYLLEIWKEQLSADRGDMWVKLNYIM